jgi:ELWxxDGT repeat protein
MCDTVRFKAVFVLLLLLCLLSAAAPAQPAFQVVDLNTTRSGGINAELFPTHFFPDHFASLGGAVFLPASDGIHGIELWRTDGTEAGTRLFADVCPGSCSSMPRGLTVVGSSVFFVANDGLHGFELWKSDGTPAGTALVADLIPHDEFGSSLHILSELNGLLLFSISPLHSTGRQELWRSDGTAAGTFLLADFGPAQSGSDSLPAPLIRFGGKLFFIAKDSAHGREVWTTDGTAAGTVLLKDIVPGPQSGAPERFRKKAAVAGGRVLFDAGDLWQGDLWASDGTEAGTVRVKDLPPGPGGTAFAEMAAVGGDVFFLVYGSGGGAELWTSDGTEAGTGRILAAPPSAQDLTAIAGKLFFFHGCELWTSDGTEAGTLLVKDIDPCASAFPLAEDGGELLFSAGDGVHGQELWKSDGTPAGTSLVADLNPGAGSSFFSSDTRGIFAGGRWYFRAREGDFFGPVQLWTTDGTPAGTDRLPINQQDSGLRVNTGGELAGRPRAFFDLDGTLLFPGSDDTTGADLWRSDGTAAGTFLVKELRFPFHIAYPSGEFTRAGETVFFRSDAGTGAEKLWKTDGTLAGTQLVYAPDHLHNGGLTSPSHLTAVGNDLLFLASWWDDFSESLMRSDGTPEGTLPVVSPSAPEQPYRPFSIVSLGDLILFQAGDGDELWKSDGTDAGTARLGFPLARRFLDESSGVRDGVLLFAGTASETGEELWRSDGTAAGTFLLAETVPGPGSKPLGPFAVAGPTLFFAAADDELWRNDAMGTSLVRALPGDPAVGIRSLTPLGAKVYFSYDDGEHGRELWVSDGTAAGTRMVEDILPGPGSSHPRQLHAEGNVLLFSATDGAHGVEPWRSDGTALGTRMLQDIAPDTLPSSPVEFTASGPNVYFAANDGTTGFELWALPRPALLATFADVPADHWAWRFVEALAANGLTNGCGADRYCPDLQVKRAETAAFLVRAAHGPSFVPPPATGTVFQDVPAGHWAAPWIEQLAADGVTSGCGGGNFCPADPLTRAEAAVLLLKARHGSGFVPPPATGTVFNDVPASHWAAAWIEKLAAEGITGGCGGGSYCPARTATRAEMAAFLAKTFGLVLP